MSSTQQEQGREARPAQKASDPARQRWYDVKRLAQRLQRHPEELTRLTSQIISTADAQLDK
ncbi:MAG TPA: hypothetical protein VGN95_25160 [Pyrinomonadaceae bacterium]|nr:hypothetical protein [Pyrinomonadaceae bacterium]